MQPFAIVTFACYILLTIFVGLDNIIYFVIHEDRTLNYPILFLVIGAYMILFLLQVVTIQSWIEKRFEEEAEEQERSLRNFLWSDTLFTMFLYYGYLVVIYVALFVATMFIAYRDKRNHENTHWNQREDN